MKRSKRFVIVGALLALVLVAGVTGVFAQGAEIHACVNAGGVPRIVAGAEDCRSKETHLVWGVGGTPGPEGPQGPKGDTGDTGPMGPKGDKGDQGEQGLSGADGLPGADGADGLPGEDGADGLPGADGADGATGPQGPAGADGADGATGPAGPAGPAGPQGPPGVLGFYRVVASGTVPAGGEGLLRAKCNAGDYVTGGGFKAGWPTNTAYEQWPNYDSGSDTWEWFVRVQSSHTADRQATAFAICADVTP